MARSNHFLLACLSVVELTFLFAFFSFLCLSINISEIGGGEDVEDYRCQTL
jgi:hypothetical protein